MKPSDPRRLDWQWLDRVVALDPERRTLVAERSIGAEEWYLEHHYPGFPVVPGVFLIEAMAHALAVLQGTLTFRATGLWRAYVLALAHEARFYSFVRAQECATIEASLTENDDGSGLVEGKVAVRVQNRKIARAKLTLHTLDEATLSSHGPANAVHDPFKLGAYVRMLLVPNLQPILVRTADQARGETHG